MAQWRTLGYYYAQLCSKDAEMQEKDRQLLENLVSGTQLLGEYISLNSDLEYAHQNFEKFVCTPSMHFLFIWRIAFFSFERFNGILGSYPNSNRAVQTELMETWAERTQIDDMVSQLKADSMLLILWKFLLKKIRKLFGRTKLLEFLEFSSPNHCRPCFGSESFPGIKFLGHGVDKKLEPSVHTLLKAVYRSDKYDFILEDDQDEYQQDPRTIVIPREARLYYRVQILQDIFGSVGQKKYAGSAMASIRLDFANLDWNCRFHDGLLPHIDLKIWAGQVKYYIEHTVQIPLELSKSDINSSAQAHNNRIFVTHRFAFVDFLKPSADKGYFRVAEVEERPYKTLVEFWGPEFLPRGIHSIVPIHRLYSRCIYGTSIYDDEGRDVDRLVVIPIVKRITV